VTRELGAFKKDLGAGDRRGSTRTSTTSASSSAASRSRWTTR
jgi:hypothetical protein